MFFGGPDMIYFDEKIIPPSVAKENERDLFMIWQENLPTSRQDRIWRTVQQWSSRPYEDYPGAFGRLNMDHRQIIREMAQLTCCDPDRAARHRLDVLRLVSDEIKASAQSSVKGDTMHRVLLTLRERLSDVQGIILEMVSNELLAAWSI